jgi:hypothetical protein
MTPDDIQTHLRQHGINVHLVTPDASGVMTVLLEGSLGQTEYAQYLLDTSASAEARSHRFYSVRLCRRTRRTLCLDHNRLALRKSSQSNQNDG